MAALAIIRPNEQAESTSRLDPDVVERELVLMRVVVDATTRAEVMQMCDIFRAKIIDVQHNVLGIEITGNESKLDKFLMLMSKFGISEITRTGRVALARKPQAAGEPIGYDRWTGVLPNCAFITRRDCSISLRASAGASLESS